MKERPIIFGGDSVRAILAGRKTQTRRVVNPKNCPRAGCLDAWQIPGVDRVLGCPFGNADDEEPQRLWVKEAFTIFQGSDGRQGVAYRATCPDDSFTYAGDDGSVEEIKILRWSSPLCMPRAFSRLTIEVVDVKVERLNQISEEDAIADGVTIPIGEGPCPCEGEEEDPGPHMPWCAWRDPDVDPDPVFDVGLPRVVTEFAIHWNKINGKKAKWSTSPFVWVVSFRRVEDGA